MDDFKGRPKHSEYFKNVFHFGLINFCYSYPYKTFINLNSVQERYKTECFQQDRFQLFVTLKAKTLL